MRGYSFLYFKKQIKNQRFSQSSNCLFHLNQNLGNKAKCSCNIFLKNQLESHFVQLEFRLRKYKQIQILYFKVCIFIGQYYVQIYARLKLLQQKNIFVFLNIKLYDDFHYLPSIYMPYFN